MISFNNSIVPGMFLVHALPIVIHFYWSTWLFVTALPWFLLRCHGCIDGELTCLHVHRNLKTRLLHRNDTN